MSKKSGTDHKKVSCFEEFMRRAFRTTNNSNPGLHGSYMQNLLNVERDEALMNKIGSFDKQLYQVKEYLQTALNQFEDKHLSEYAKDTIEFSKIKVELANTSDDLISIIKTVMEVTKSVKN